MSASKIPVMEIEMDYSHFQHLIQTSSDGLAPDVTPHPVTVTLTDAAGSPAVFPLSEVIDLSMPASEQCPAVSGEKTPGTYGEVPGFLLDIAKGCPGAKTSVYSHNRSGSAVRVCLEKRFNIMLTDASNQQDIRPLSKHQQLQEGQEGVFQPQIQPWINPDRSNSFEVSNPLVPFVFNAVANVGEQVFSQLPHVVEQKHQGLMMPFKVDSETLGDKAHLNSSSSSGEQCSSFEDAVGKTVAASRSRGRDNVGGEATPDGSGESGRRCRAQDSGCRKERHNLKERERRRMIRFYCNELKTLVPFCHAKSDKVTTLHWTTAYLRHIQRTHGDVVREEFEKMVSQGKGLTPELWSSSLHKEISAAEQPPSGVQSSSRSNRQAALFHDNFFHSL